MQNVASTLKSQLLNQIFVEEVKNEGEAHVKSEVHSLSYISHNSEFKLDKARRLSFDSLHS